MSVVLDVTVRDDTGTGAAREARRNGMVPGVIYGGDEDAVAVAVKMNEVLKAMNTGDFLGSMIELSHEGKKQKVFTKDVQFHPVTDFPQHVDFYRVTNKTLIDVEVTVNFVGEENSPGLKEGGTLNVVRYSIEVTCPAGDIPDHFEADVSKMEIGDTLNISDIDMPKGAKPTITDRDFTIATVVASRAAVEEDAEEDVDADEVPAIEQNPQIDTDGDGEA
ncbi:50S ribosomal protein L25/general stress protein Ctc [Algimonas porphyrae]|uniref:Large ribosomal subunit protein bL25 n=1 Tax=Algimonas porphyrae TaxID=1128113 RepID=A0ABQ5UXV5_9PROT|nr:50S ribosomal protein L25/general stress protein Ctc [Algimonas porphyrae]GLQ20134.1 50S ribosomal protein L25 [Algimonas porphyrae]